MRRNAFLAALTAMLLAPWLWLTGRDPEPEPPPQPEGPQPRKARWTIQATYNGEFRPEENANSVIPPGPWYSPDAHSLYTFESGRHRAEWQGLVDPDHRFHSTVRIR